MADWTPDITLDEEILLAAAVFELLQGSGNRAGTRGRSVDDAEAGPDPWENLDSWRNVHSG